MITAEKLRILTSMPHTNIQALITPSLKLTGARFLGITNGGQFCYSVTYTEHDAEQTGKVFLTYDPTAGKVSADY